MTRLPTWVLVLWQIVPFVAVVGLLVALSGCTRPLDTAILAANSARDVGEVSAEVLQSRCTDRYAVATRAEVAALDVYCVPAARAYDTYRAAHAALVAAVQVVQIGGAPEGPMLIQLVARLATAGASLSRAIGGVQ